ncbi:GrpB family protein [Anaerosacchariphilus polymeriproducens]|uniref:GrpB family protein n=1 Tax=Anaerosacchariphilus polymeriproducens TaxID=1812858 RepID=A0A371AVS6_9FIRM|nr:GrpB family protein [Anaerosacchariphilus polymeriproducens]RDU23673.1 GrpB family protein [Anaerosacchariphilus polymeriproducens]
MGKKLSEMNLEELWHLFPIFLTEHQGCWKDWYKEEEKLLKSILPENQILQINHIGSTAIEAIWAKPIIDILVEISKECDMSGIKQILVQNGYTCMQQMENRISLNKGYTEKGFAEKVFHLHLRYIGDNNELYFRDYLNEHSDIAIEYEELKLCLWKKYEHDRNGYTDAKTEFVAKYTEAARKKCGDKI